MGIKKWMKTFVRRDETTLLTSARCSDFILLTPQGLEARVYSVCCVWTERLACLGLDHCIKMQVSLISKGLYFLCRGQKEHRSHTHMRVFHMSKWVQCFCHSYALILESGAHRLPTLSPIQEPLISEMPH